MKEAAISDVVEGVSATLRLVTLEDFEYIIQWDVSGLKILSKK